MDRWLFFLRYEKRLFGRRLLGRDRNRNVMTVTVHNNFRIYPRTLNLTLTMHCFDLCQLF